MAGAADEGDRQTLLRERVEAARDPGEGNVLRPTRPAAAPLRRLAHVDEDELPGIEPASRLGDVDRPPAAPEQPADHAPSGVAGAAHDAHSLFAAQLFAPISSRAAASPVAPLPRFAAMISR